MLEATEAGWLPHVELRAELEALLSEDVVAAIKREQSLFDTLTSPLNESLVLFGAGGLGRKTLAGLRQLGREPLAFVDNDPNLWSRAVDGLAVLSPQAAAGRFGSSAAFIVTIWRAEGGHRFAHTRQQLHDLNCAKVVSFACLFWKYPDIFLPYYAVDLPHKFYAQSNDIGHAFAVWADDDSRREYIAQLRWRFWLDFDGLRSPVGHPQYFPDDLFHLSADEVFVDCGAYDGDTIRHLLLRQPSFRGKIFCFEPDPRNFQKLERYIRTLKKSLRDRITLWPAAVGMRHETVRFKGTATAASGVSPTGDLKVSFLPLDEVIGDFRPTFIKMDIEGVELEALMGARNTIDQTLPILAICVYHQLDHLWRIPLFMQSVSNQYRFYLRPHNEEGWELVCYAVPEGRLKGVSRKAISCGKRTDRRVVR
ncbi:MAG: FkbM family methyltransferase [Acidobacteria bacterium]|nr:FkbM family methyltransferase [Acidobacteriota bacterium]